MKRRHRILLALAAPALAAAGCGGPTERDQAPTVRLIERLGDAEVRGELPAEAPPATRLSRILRPRDRDYLGRVALEVPDGEVEERLAIVIPGGTRLRFPIEVTGKASLRLGLGRLRSEPAPAGTAELPVRAVARRVDSEGASPIVEQTLDTAQWVDLALERHLTTGTMIELEAQGPEGTWVAFSSPELVGLEPDGWDVLLISLDTLRADHLSAYGYERPTSPHLDAFAAEGFRFAQAYSHAPWTLPSHQSLFNGLYPHSHGDLRSVTLARALWLEGYRTVARTGGGVMDYRMGTLARGFDSYRNHDWIRDLDAVDRALAATDGRRRLLFLHTYEPHDPYIDTRFADALPAGRIEGYFDKGLYPSVRHDITDDERAYIKALYDGDIAFTDEQLGELFRRLEASGALERTIVAITSDHGEQFWEHGSWRHGQNLYDEQIHVPLILRLPEKLRRELGLPRGAVIDDQVRLVDIYPTLLELLGIPLERRIQGRSLVPALRGERMEPSESLAEGLNVVNVISKAIRLRGFKFLRSERVDPPGEEAKHELYDLRRDPAELVNLIDERPEVAAELQAILAHLIGGEWSDEGLDTEGLDPDLRRALEALGYIGDG